MKYYSFVIFLFSLVLLTGCTAPSQTINSWGDTTTPIKIWVITPLAWGAAVYGEDATRAYNYVVDKVNADGGIDGREVELIYENGACGWKEATNAIQKLINIDGVTMILGWVCSAETIPAGQIAQQNEVVLVSALSSSPEISNIGDYVFRYWNDADAGVSVAGYLESQWAQSISLITENSDYAISYGQAVKDNFDGDIVLEEKIQADEKDLSIVAKKIWWIVETSDFIIFAAANESLNKWLLLALENEWILETVQEKLLGGEVMLTDSVLEELWSAVNGVKTTTLSDRLGWDFSAVLADLQNDYDVKSSNVFIMLLADSADLLIDAISEVGTDAEAVKNYISGFTQENPRVSLIGDFWFDAEGDGQWLQFVVKEARDGVLVEVE